MTYAVDSIARTAPVRLKAPGDALTRLIGLSLTSIQDATARRAAGGSVAAWRRELERAITTAHQATLITATAQRLGVGADSALISRARLSKAERDDIKQAVRAQLVYLDRFAAAVAAGDLSDAQIAARANLYAGAIKEFYARQRWGDWDIPDQLLPGTAECLGNCTCSITVSDNGDGTGVLTRTLGATEQHCKTCPTLAGDHPVKRRGA